MKITSRSSTRKTRGSQKRSKKRTRSSREKTKKAKQRDDSISCSDDELVSTSSVSYSSSGDDYRSKKRSRSRDRKSSKDKKSKRSRLVSDSSGDDDSPFVKKPKTLKKNRSFESRKKRHRKRRRRDCSFSSSRSSPSRSSSVCEPIVDIEKKEEKERKGREKVKERNGRKRLRSNRSKSCSPCHSKDHEEKALEKNSPKRLKSIIVVTKERGVIEELESNRDDGHNDEIVFDFDDYPSKSNDSNDGVSGRETVPNAHDVSSEKRFLDEPNRESIVSDVKTSEVFGVERQIVDGSGVTSPSYVRLVDDTSIGNGSKLCTSYVGSNHDDLEAILRQKALENLLKRRGELSTKVSVTKKDDVNIELENPSIMKTHPVDQPQEGNILSGQNVGKVDGLKHTTTSLRGASIDTGPSIDNNAHLLSRRVRTAPPEDLGKSPSDCVISKPKVSLSMSRKEFLGAKNTWKRQSTPQESSQKNLSTPGEFIIEDSKQQVSSREYSDSKISAPQERISKNCTSDSSPKIDFKGSTENVEAVALTDPSTSRGQSLNDKTNEADEETQFQKKTMSVMRGGEMVQVSYKVYIPKKTPALARRQLKR